MRLLIVEDESVAARRLEQFCRQILGARLESLRIAPRFEIAESLVATSPIDVLLLDLNLEGRDGMELLASSVAGSFHTIIVSANTAEALRAFEFGVADFIAKPFKLDRLAQALARVSNPASHGVHVARSLAVTKAGRVALVPVDDVLYVKGADDYSELVLRNGRRELHNKTLERLQAILPSTFERVHKSYLVRMSEVLQLRTQEGGRYSLELRNGTRLPVGRTRYRDIRARLG